MTILDFESELDTLLSGSVAVYQLREVTKGSVTPNRATGFLQVITSSSQRIGGNDDFPVRRYTAECELVAEANKESTLRTLLNTLHAKANNNNRNTNSNKKWVLFVDDESQIDAGWIELTIELTDYYTEAATS